MIIYVAYDNNLKSKHWHPHNVNAANGRAVQAIPWGPRQQAASAHAPVPKTTAMEQLSFLLSLLARPLPSQPSGWLAMRNSRPTPSREGVKRHHSCQRKSDLAMSEMSRRNSRPNRLNSCNYLLLCAHRTTYPIPERNKQPYLPWICYNSF